MTNIYKSGRALAQEIKDTNMPYGTVAIWHLGQSGVVIKGKSSDGAIVIDPYLTYSIEEANPETEFKRAFPPPILPNELVNITGVLVTHHHDDHLDVNSLFGIASSNKAVKIAIPAGTLNTLIRAKMNPKNLKSIKDGSSFFINGFTMTPIPVAHTEYESDADGNPLYYGYFIEVNGVKLFHSGDTLVTKQILQSTKAFQPDIAFLPINGGDYARTKRGIIGNMNFREAADFSVEVKADMFLPIHYDLFPNNRDNPSYLVDYLFHHYPVQKFHMMVPGERFIYYK